jgi:hypothetical protein
MHGRAAAHRRAPTELGGVQTAAFEVATNTCMHSANTRQRATPTPTMAAFRPQRSIYLRRQYNKHAESPRVMGARLVRLKHVWSPRSEMSDRHTVLSSAAGVHLAGAGMMAATGHSCRALLFNADLQGRASPRRQ